MQGQSSEPPSELRLRKGEIRRFHLGGAGPAGYGWSWTVEGNSGCASVALKAEAEPKPVPGTMASSSTRDQVLTITGARAGRMVLNLKLSRSFQPSRPPLAAYRISIEVLTR